MKSLNCINNLTIANIDGEVYIKSIFLKPSGDFLAIHMLKKVVVEGSDIYLLVFPSDVSLDIGLKLQNNNLFRPLSDIELKNFQVSREKLIKEVISENEQEVVTWKECFNRILTLNKSDVEGMLLLQDLFLNLDGTIQVCPSVRDIVPYILGEFMLIRNINEEFIQFSNNEFALLFEKNEMTYIIFLESDMDENGAVDYSNVSVFQISALIDVNNCMNVIEEVKETEYELSEKEVTFKLNDFFKKFNIEFKAN